MHDELALFVSPASVDAQAVTDVVCTILGDEFAQVSADNARLGLAGADAFVCVELAEGYVDDRDLPLSRYKAVVWIDARRAGSSSDVDGAVVVARQLFDAFRATRQFRLLLVSNLQHLVDRYDPSA